MSGYTYDSGALIAAERNDARLWRWHRDALGAGVAPTVPAGVLGEVWRGGPQALLSRLLKDCRIEPLDEEQARFVGFLASLSGLDDTVDLAVAEGALRRDDVVITSNRRHIEQVVHGAGGSVEIWDI